MPIVVEHLTKRYASGTLALDDIAFDVADGEFVAVVGPSGCGKSTLLRILAGLETSTSGRAAVEVDAPRLPSALVPQDASLLPWLRVAENVAFAFDGLGLPPEDVRRRVREQLELVGLTPFARAYPHELSGGMKQRVAVARAFAVDAPVLLMDEPFGALDEQTRIRLQGELAALWERSRKTVVFITHGIEESIALADRVVVMSARPGTIKEIVTVDLPRPRDVVALRADPRFGELVVHVWSLLGRGDVGAA